MQWSSQGEGATGEPMNPNAKPFSLNASVPEWAPPSATTSAHAVAAHGANGSSSASNAVVTAEVVVGSADEEPDEIDETVRRGDGQVASTVRGSRGLLV